MVLSARFFKFAAICAFVTAFTTVAIHLLPSWWADATTFERQLTLRHNPIYMARLWMVIVHCLLVVVSMFAVGAHRLARSPALVVFGSLGFLVFAYTEVMRAALAIFALNRTWRAQYAAGADDEALTALRTTIAAFGGVNDALFFVFSLGFLAGLLCYGTALRRGDSVERQLAAVLLVWAALSVTGFLDTVAETSVFSPHLSWVGSYFQPVARLLIGAWLWKVSAAAPEVPRVSPLVV